METFAILAVAAIVSHLSAFGAGMYVESRHTAQITKAVTEATNVANQIKAIVDKPANATVTP